MKPEREPGALRLRRQAFWSGKVEGQEATRVFEELSNPNWDWRTIGSLSSYTGLPAETVKEVFSKYPTLVRTWPYEDENGNILFTLRSEPRTFREILANIQKFI